MERDYSGPQSGQRALRRTSTALCKFALCLCLTALSELAVGQTLNTVAGGGPAASIPPDGAKATSAAVGRISSITVDNAGNVYFLSDSLNRLFEVSSSGAFTTAAGNSRIIYYTQGPGQYFADLIYATGVATDQSGNVVVSSRNGVLTLQGSNYASLTSSTTYASKAAFDSLGNLYTADTYNHRVLKNGGIVAGNGNPGFSGDGVAATSSSLNFPTGVAVDAGGNLYIADTGNHRVRMVSGGIITTVAGTGIPGYSGDFGQAADAQLNRPSRVAVDSSGSLYIADSLNHRVRKVSSGIVTTVAGNGAPGYSGDGASATGAQLFFPEDVAVDSSGNLYIADLLNSRVRKVTNGVIATIAGNGSGDSSGDGGAATSAFFQSLFNVAVDHGGNLYFGDGHGRVRMVSGGVITTVAGNGTFGYSGDGGPATSAQLNDATAVAVDSAGNLYIADSISSVIRKVSNGTITTIAGNGSAGYSGDGGPATSAQFNGLSGLAVDKSGSLYVADAGNGRVRKVAGGMITTFAGTGQCCYTGDGGPATSALLQSSGGLAVDDAGNVYIAGADVVRMVSGGIITTVAGVYENCYFGSIGDGGPATSALFCPPAGLAVDQAGNLYIADSNHGRVRKVSGGQITTVAGLNGELTSPWGLAIDAAANLYIADAGNQNIRQLTLASSTTVTITTNQTGLAVVVDGVTYAAPQTFSWTGGSHTIGVVSPQSGTGARYGFLNWSDGGAQAHTITAPFSASYTANFTAQYPLVTTVSPPGSGILSANPASPDGYYNSGAVVQLTAVSNPNFQFSAWSGDLSGAANPQSLTMSGVRRVTAAFASSPWPVAVGAQPSSGALTSQTFAFQFSHPSGWQALSVVNILINNFLDGRQACYLAYVVSSASLALVDDAGDAGGPFAGSQNSQCAVSLVSAMGNGGTLTLTLNITFKPAFGGNKIVYLAARDSVRNNSGWQALGVWQVPFTAAGTISVGSLSPARGASVSGTPQAFTLTVTDTNGATDIGIVNLLVNNSLDGRQACYLAYVASSNTLLLVDDAGDAGGPYAGMVLNGGGGSIQNSQCAVSGAGSSALLAGNTLTLTLNVTFAASFTGNRILYAAGRDNAGGNNTGWQSVGTWTVQ